MTDSQKYRSAKEVPAWLTRLYAEMNDLAAKINNLENFFSSDLYKGLSEEHQNLLKIQSQAMKTYYEVLYRRIELHDKALFKDSWVETESVVDTEIAEDQSPAVEAEDVNQEHGM